VHCVARAKSAPYHCLAYVGVQPVAPVDVRALAVKTEFADIEKLKAQMTSKDESVTKMKLLLKAKVCLLPAPVVG